MTLPNLTKALMLLPLLALTQCDKVHDLVKPKPSAYAFDVTVRMSPKAEEAMAHSMGLVIKASYYGYAKPEYRGDADNLNRLYVGDESWNYGKAARKLHLHGEPVDTSVLPHTTDGQVYVLVAVTGLVGGPDSGDDTVNCRSYIGTVTFAQQDPPVLDCEFASENYWDTLADSSSSASQ